MQLNLPQRRSLHRIWQRDNQNQSYLQFRRSVQPGPGCAMVLWCNMWLGIEPDGYTHS